ESEFSIGKKIPAKNWNSKTKRVYGCLDAKLINSRINQIESDLERHFFKLQFEHEYISPIMVRNVYKGLSADYKPGESQNSNESQTRSILALADQHVQDFTEMVRKRIRSAETLRQWKATRNKIAEFITKNYRSADLDLETIDYSFATKFYKYLTIDREKVIGEAAAKKQIK
ncbi:phage integrase SAM-like domain-containing protein, partial [Sphingobacterium sp. HJSM2_6]|uniref:phage integrase SAM-like domain-containing protein n=1 Tax=Sphingobacterium sp. HJSM2_6 TaxID=3366264 RepID=UPI003BC95860